jgi:hypothetical protein
MSDEISDQMSDEMCDEMSDASRVHMTDGHTQWR